MDVGGNLSETEVAKAFLEYKTVTKDLPQLLNEAGSFRRLCEAYWTDALAPEEERTLEDSAPKEVLASYKPIEREAVSGHFTENYRVEMHVSKKSIFRDESDEDLARAYLFPALNQFRRMLDQVKSESFLFTITARPQP